jgi:heterotetrameric sarcosine oxidase delta subunit
MLIPCPHCGPRDVAEFTYQGDGTRTRPDPASTDPAAWHAYVYERLNPAGDHHELWQHSGGCRAHLKLVRNTATHAIGASRLAADPDPAAAAARPDAAT